MSSKPNGKSEPSVNDLFQAAHAEGVLSPESLQALTAVGEPTWRCDGYAEITAGPMVATAEGAPTAVVWADAEGWIRVRVETADGLCDSFQFHNHLNITGLTLLSRSEGTAGFELSFAAAGVDGQTAVIERYRYCHGAYCAGENSNWKQDWVFGTTGAVTASAPFYNQADDMLIFIAGPKIYKINADTGLKTGDSLIDAEMGAGLSADVDKGLLYFTTNSTANDVNTSNIFTYNMTSLNQKPTFPISFYSGYRAQPLIVPDGGPGKSRRVVVSVEAQSDASPYLQVLEAATQEPVNRLWSFGTGGRVLATPAIYDGRIYAATTFIPGAVFSLPLYPDDPASMTYDWSEEATAPVDRPVLMTPWGDIIIIDHALVVQSFAARAPLGAAPGGWPQFQGGPQRLGRP